MWEVKQALPRTTFLIVLLFFAVIGCTDEDASDEHNDGEENMKEESADRFHEEKSNEKEESVDEEANIDEASLHEEIFLSGQVTLEEEVIHVDGESNLLEGTVVTARLLASPFNIYRSSTVPLQNTKASVNGEGNFQMELRYEDYSNTNFFERFEGSYVELELTVAMDRNQSDEAIDFYGDKGENFHGPFTYQVDERTGPAKQIYAPVLLGIGDEQTVYEIEKPALVTPPDDYGEPTIWIEIDEITTDHRFFYVSGQSNLLEGTAITGGYYSDQRYPPQGGHPSITWVNQDGTFLLRAPYRSFKEDNFLWIRSTPGNRHRAPSIVEEAYGEDFEALVGEYVIDNEKDDQQEIEIIIEPESLGIAVPDDTDITEDNGEYKVQIPDDVLFDFDEYDLKNEATETLDEIIMFLEELDEQTSIEINGHTDNQGDADYNMDLSEQRAQSVEAYLTEHGDIQHLNLVTQGFGQTKPIDSNEESSGRERNRRVEIVIKNEE